MYGLKKEEVFKATYVTRILMGQIKIDDFIETDARLKLNVKTAL